MKACDKNSPKTPAHLQPPPGSSCQAVHLLFAPLLACRLVKGGGTSILVPFNPLPTSCTAFYLLSQDYIDLAKARKLVRYDIVWAMSANIIQQASVIMKILMSREKNCKNCVLMKMIQKLW